MCCDCFISLGIIQPAVSFTVPPEHLGINITSDFQVPYALDYKIKLTGKTQYGRGLEDSISL